MQTINIITPVTRPSNLPAVYHSVLENIKEKHEHIHIIWHVIFDASVESQGKDWEVRFSRDRHPGVHIITYHSDTSSSKGYAHRNRILDVLFVSYKSKHEIGDEWIWFMDDDTILHTNFLDWLQVNEKFISHIDLLCFNQVASNGSIRFSVFGKEINTFHRGMIMLRLRILNDCRFDEHNAFADVDFLDKLNCVDQERLTNVQPVNLPMSIYNYLG